MNWKVTFYSTRVEAEINALPAGFVARFVRYAERMETYGPNLGMPHTRPMGDGLFELRLKAAEGIARVFFCTVIERQIVVLHQFVKKSEKTPKRELQIAWNRMREIRGLLKFESFWLSGNISTS